MTTTKHDIIAEDTTEVVAVKIWELPVRLTHWAIFFAVIVLSVTGYFIGNPYADTGSEPGETFYDGYVLNAIMDACYRSVETRQWAPVELAVWRGAEGSGAATGTQEYDERYFLIKEEKMPDGKTKLILKDKESGKIVQQIK